MPEAHRYATLDVGSNSVLLHVAERRPDGSFTGLADRVELSRLGEGLKDTGRFSEPAMDRTLEAICRFKALADELGAEAVAAVGTMAMRNAANARDFAEQVRSRCGVDIEVIPGEEEARLGYLAVRSGLPAELLRLVVMDVGGGSTELIRGSGQAIEHRQSLNVGSLHMTEQHLVHDPVLPEELRALRQALQQAFADLEAVDADTGLVGIGGTITNMCAVELKMEVYDPERIQTSCLSREAVEAQLERYAASSVAERRAIAGLQPKRADTILAGAAIVAAVMDRLAFESLCVSDRGVRHGLLVDRFGA
ncbi:MAG: Ppx/GppA family phosphatase [Deltaproteobacteria bacterium]|nr:Ppx/GppA family phosphatase [Deltaproteobacteria bacterium]